MSARRCVTQFRRTGGEDFVREYELRGVRVAQLQKLFEAGSDDPQMVLCYPVTEKQRPFLEQSLGKSLDLRKYDYFVEAYVDSVRASRPQSAAAASRR